MSYSLSNKIFGVDSLNVTISVGVSEFQKQNEKAPEKLYQNADIALYEAKKRGRNRVIVYDKNME